MCQQDVSIWLVSTEGRPTIDWLVIRRARPSGSIRADTVNTELRRVDRSLTNGHQPTGGAWRLTRRLPAIPYCQAEVWVKGCGVWCYRSLDETPGSPRETVSETSLQSVERVIFFFSCESSAAWVLSQWAKRLKKQTDKAGDTRYYQIKCPQACVCLLHCLQTVYFDSEMILKNKNVPIISVHSLHPIMNLQLTWTLTSCFTVVT